MKSSCTIKYIFIKYCQVRRDESSQPLLTAGGKVARPRDRSEINQKSKRQKHTHQDYHKYAQM